MRLFVAVDLGEEVRERLADVIRRASRRAPDARWVKPENVHVTLAFLGHLPDEKVPSLSAALDAAAAPHPPFDVAVRGVGTFGTRAHPRVLWIGLETAGLAPLQKDVSHALVPLGYAPEKRPYTPHLTLARAREMRGDAALAKAAQALEGVDLGVAQVTEVILFQSQLSPKGARYTAMHRAALRG